MPVRRRSGVTYEPSGDHLVVLDAAGTVMTTLNPIGALIFRALDGKRDTAALASELAPTFEKVNEDTLATDIDEFVAELREADLVEDAG